VISYHLRAIGVYLDLIEKRCHHEITKSHKWFTVSQNKIKKMATFPSSTTSASSAPGPSLAFATPGCVAGVTPATRPYCPHQRSRRRHPPRHLLLWLETARAVLRACIEPPHAPVPQQKKFTAAKPHGALRSTTSQARCANQGITEFLNAPNKVAASH
jgi:hypothetical protein